MRKRRKMLFEVRKISSRKASGRPVFSYYSDIDFGTTFYTAKPKQEFCFKEDFKIAVQWRKIDAMRFKGANYEMERF